MMVESKYDDCLYERVISRRNGLDHFELLVKGCCDDFITFHTVMKSNKFSGPHDLPSFVKEAATNANYTFYMAEELTNILKSIADFWEAQKNDG